MAQPSHRRLASIGFPIGRSGRSASAALGLRRQEAYAIVTCLYAQSPPFKRTPGSIPDGADLRAGVLQVFVGPVGQAVNDEFRLPIGQAPGILKASRAQNGSLISNSHEGLSPYEKLMK
jgi:hypothetical protein